MKELRGTSIYLVDRVIPMLPHKLSNGICSLNEGVDRYAISCIMEINDKGQVLDHNIYPTVIRSSHRMTYNNVNAILAGHKGLKNKYHQSRVICPLSSRQGAYQRPVVFL